MTSRPSLGPASGVIPGSTFFEEYSRAMKALFDAANFPLSSVTGTGDVVSALLQWDLDVAGLLNGMKFTITWAANNTGPATLSVNGGAPTPLLTATGASLAGGALVAGSRSLIEFVGGSFLVLTSSSANSGYIDTPYHTLITTSQTWIKPLGYADEHAVTIEVWGGGGGGGIVNSFVSGGGGGGYSTRIMNYIDVPSSVAVAIGAGGASGASGGTTSFGTILYGYGGTSGSQASSSSSLVPGGSGGGNYSGSLTGGDGSYAGGSGSNAGSSTTVGQSSFWGGGGGGSKQGVTSTAPGVSTNGGGGGVNGSPGIVPSGGGGALASGARGQVRIRL